jgi:predicted GH43/DUF377 family glycosyl hydrolase
LRNPWESKAVFNPGAVLRNQRVYLLYRAVGEYERYISRFGLATSRDGVNFRRYRKPVFCPEPSKRYEKWGVEDPRITPLEGKFYITYVALRKPAHWGGGPPRTALATTQNFRDFIKHGVITPPEADERDVVLFPERIKGKYVMLHRPHNWTTRDILRKNGKVYVKVREVIAKWWPFARRISHVRERRRAWPLHEVPRDFPRKPSIWIAFSRDLHKWFSHKVLLRPHTEWEKVKIGAGAPPIKTEAGWLCIYHGVGERDHVRRYCAGAFLLDLKKPCRVIGRTAQPILSPRKFYELSGDAPGVVFPEGVVVLRKKLFVYYGAADKTVCLATCNLDKLLTILTKR